MYGYHFCRVYTVCNANIAAVGFIAEDSDMPTASELVMHGGICVRCFFELIS